MMKNMPLKRMKNVTLDAAPLRPFVTFAICRRHHRSNPMH